MLSTPRTRKAGLGLAVLAIAAAVGLGFVLRLADPLANPVIPAEDPFTHMALVKEHLRTGTLDPLYAQGGLYPPGLHAFMAVAWSYSGIDLEQIVLMGPVFLGAIGVLGMALLLTRNGGPLAGFVGALALAVAPEAIFRTNMMSPTALDLALVPFLLLALVELLKGKMGWLGVVAPMCLFFVFSHPWLFPILALTGVVFLVLAYGLPWSSRRHAPLSTLGVAGAIACIGLGLGLGLSTCGGYCGPGLRDVMTLPHNGFFDALPQILMAVSVVPLALLVARPALRTRVAAWAPTERRPLWLRIAASAAIAATLYAVTMPAVQHGMPEYVDLPKMFGWPILVLAFAMLVALPFLPSPAAYAGAGIFAATYPYVIYNPLHSPFWPHRTAVFMGIGLVILVGAFAGAAAHAVAGAWSHFIERRARKTVPNGTPAVAPGRGSHALMLMAVLAVPAFIGGTVYHETPDGYSGGWYRLYPECEMDALKEVAAKLDADPDAMVMTGDWQAKLVIAAFSSDASRVAYKQTFFTIQKSHEDTVAQMQHNGRTLLVVVDRYLTTETPDADTGFLQSEPFHPLGAWCSGGGTGQVRISAYTTGAAQ
ncbi:MAG TPA: hypothetical protein VM286_05410 [Candidatus Thermoplasmatota archaeon]|nr:hypothetical protein [Candidatus Thermoplasmatota archaeon]